MYRNKLHVHVKKNTFEGNCFTFYVTCTCSSTIYAYSEFYVLPKVNVYVLRFTKRFTERKDELFACKIPPTPRHQIHKDTFQCFLCVD